MLIKNKVELKASQVRGQAGLKKSILDFGREVTHIWNHALHSEDYDFTS